MCVFCACCMLALQDKALDAYLTAGMTYPWLPAVLLLKICKPALQLVLHLLTHLGPVAVRHPPAYPSFHQFVCVKEKTITEMQLNLPSRQCGSHVSGRQYVKESVYVKEKLVIITYASECNPTMLELGVNDRFTQTV